VFLGINSSLYREVARGAVSGDPALAAPSSGFGLQQCPVPPASVVRVPGDTDLEERVQSCSVSHQYDAELLGALGVAPGLQLGLQLLGHLPGRQWLPQGIAKTDITTIPMRAGQDTHPRRRGA